MRKIFYLFATCICGCVLAGCNGNKKAEIQRPDVFVEASEPDTTLYGICGEGTMMNSLELINEKGDTLTLLMNAPDTTTVVLGGLLAGDRMAVITYKGNEGETFASTVINLTTLVGKWSSIDRTFEIQEGGAVVCDQQEPKPYVDWKICNGKLILTSDTFSIFSLGADSLLLENANGIYAYKRITE